MDSIQNNKITQANSAKFTVLSKAEQKSEKSDVSQTGTTPKDNVEIGSGSQQLMKSSATDKELTVMFYMHGQYDDIGKSTAEALMSMERAGSNKNLNVVSQLGRNPYKPDEEGEFHIPLDNDWSGVRRYYVNQNDHANLDMTMQDWIGLEEKIPDNPVLHFVLGNIYWGNKEHDKAMEYYSRCRELGMLDYMADYNSDKSKAVRAQFEAATRPFEEASAPYNKFASSVQEVLPEGTKMGDPASLQNFVEWGMKKYPAEHYMLVVMGHGGAWIGAAEQSPAEMGEAITQGVKTANEQTGRKDKIDVLSFNSCYMGNAEALYEMKDAAEVTLASENYARSGIFGHWGMFLDAVSRDMSAGKPFNGREFAKELVDFYGKQGKEIKENFPEFSAWKESFLTLSAVDNSKLDGLADAFKGFTQSLDKYNVPDHVLFKDVSASKNYDSNAHNPSQVFGFYDTIRDMGDFMDNIRKNPDIPVEVKDHAAQVKQAMSEAIIAEQHEGKGMEGSQGLTFWGPSNAVDVLFMGKRYTDEVGGFAKGTSWGKRLLSATQKIPKETVSGFMDSINKVREINQKLQDPNLTSEDKEMLLATKEEENKKALDFKKQMDFTVEREPEKPGIFKRSGPGRVDLEAMSKIGDEMIENIVTGNSNM